MKEVFTTAGIEFTGILFDGTPESALDIIRAVKQSDTVNLVGARIEGIDEGMSNSVLHIVIVNGQVIYAGSGGVANAIYLTVHAGDVFAFMGDLGTVINMKLLEPLGIEMRGFSGKQAVEQDGKVFTVDPDDWSAFDGDGYKDVEEK